MKRDELEHILRASAAILNEDEFIVIGSQSILGSVPNASGPLALSCEADLYPMKSPGKAEILSVTIGELSRFHEAFGVYADGVGPETAILPAGWEGRLVPLRTGGGTIGWCLAPVDLAVSKYVAGRPKDRTFMAGMVRLGLFTPEEFSQRLVETPIDEEAKARVGQAYEADLAGRRGGRPEGLSP